jgi:hypothetical protein
VAPSTQSDIKGSFTAVPPVGFRNAGDNRAQRRLGQPFRRSTAQDSIASHAFPGNHQKRPGAFRMGAQNEAGQSASRTVLIEAVQIDRSLRPPANEPAMAAGFNGLWSIFTRRRPP